MPGERAKRDVDQHRRARRVGDVGLGDAGTCPTWRCRSAGRSGSAGRAGGPRWIVSVLSRSVNVRAVGNDELGVSRARRCRCAGSRSRSIRRCSACTRPCWRAAGRPEAILVAGDPVAAGPGAPGAAPLRAEAMAGETTTPKAKASAATDPNVTPFQTRAGIFRTSAVNPRNSAGHCNPTTRTSSPFHIETGCTRPSPARQWRGQVQVPAPHRRGNQDRILKGLPQRDSYASW